MSKKQIKKYDDYFEDIEKDLVEEKFCNENIEVVPELIWFYCPQCRGNSKTWSNKTPKQCFKCGYTAQKKAPSKLTRPSKKVPTF